jgi:hypothetical protein
LPGQQFGEQGLDEVVKMINLLELAATVLIELAFAGQDVQLLEQFDGLLGFDLGNGYYGFS